MNKENCLYHNRNGGEKQMGRAGGWKWGCFLRRFTKDILDFLLKIDYYVKENVYIRFNVTFVNDSLYNLI